MRLLKLKQKQKVKQHSPQFIFDAIGTHWIIDIYNERFVSTNCLSTWNKFFDLKWLFKSTNLAHMGFKHVVEKHELKYFFVGYNLM